MGLLKKLFGRQSGSVGNFIETGEGLMTLTQSDQIAAAELEHFKERVKDAESKNEIEDEARKSSDALSGYGISVSAKAFIEILEQE